MSADVVPSVEAEEQRRLLDEPRPGRKLIFAIVSLALLMASVDATIVATALPALQRDLDAQVNWSSWTITIYALGQIIVMPLAGKLGDHFGRKRIFVGAVAVFTVTSLACGLANDIYVLVVLRGLQAIGGGAFMPTATGIVSEQFGRERDRALGLFISVFPIGGIIGPVLGGVFVTYWSWRGIFLVNVPIGVLLFILTIVFIPATKRTRHARVDLVGITLLGATLLSAMLGVAYLGNGSSSSFASPLFIGPEVLALVALFFFGRHAARAEAPFIPARLLVGHGFGVMNLVNFLYGASALGFGAMVPLYAEQRYGIDSLRAGTLLTARAIGMIATAGLAVLLLRRFGYRRPMVVGFLVVIVGLCGIAITPVHYSAYTWLSIAAGATGIGMGLSMPAANTATLSLAPESAASIAGLRGMFRQSGGIIAVSVTAAVLARSSDPGHAQAIVFVVFAALMLCTLPLVVLRVPELHGPP